MLLRGFQLGTPQEVTGWSSHSRVSKRCSMKKETPKDGQDEKGQTSGDESLKQTDKPWKAHPEKEQRRGPPPDLENWQKSNTH
jgi:hypothetical protein